MAKVTGPNGEDFRVWKSGKDNLWWIWQVHDPNPYYPATRVSKIGYLSKRKAMIDARGVRETSRHPTEEEQAVWAANFKRTRLMEPLD